MCHVEPAPKFAARATARGDPCAARERPGSAPTEKLSLRRGSSARPPPARPPLPRVLAHPSAVREAGSDRVRAILEPI